jgi:predicted phosphoribosyltransferase
MLTDTVYQDRRDAGRHLARRFDALEGHSDVIVLALPRGGVPVGYEVARHLNAPLDVFVVRKLGVPGYSELAMGAIASGNIRVLNREVIARLRIPPRDVETVTAEQQLELERRERQYRGSRPPIELHGKTVVLVDDGLATGATMRAAVRALKTCAPARLIVGVPVGARETCEEFEDEVDEVICACTPDDFRAVGVWYRDFSQTTDEEVCALLEEISGQHPTYADSTEHAIRES